VAIVKQTAVERLASLLEREVALEALVRELQPGKQQDAQLRALIKTLKPE
jgi:hypothetical protein